MHLLILHFAHVFGGAERTTANLLAHLDRTQIRHLTLVAPKWLRRYFPKTFDEFVATEAYSLTGCFTTATALWRDVGAVSGLLSDRRPDVALGMMHYPSALVVFGARLAGLRTTRTVASYRGPFYEYMRHYERKIWRRCFLWTTVAATAWCADRVIVPSHGTAGELRRCFGTPSNRIIAIPNGIDYAAVARLAEQKTSNCFSRPLLCAVARLTPEKNLSLLLTAFRRVRAVQPATLIILGVGPEQESLERYIAEWGLRDVVRLLGHRDNVYPYLRQADVFIHTCHFEGFGYAVLEALACGTAVVATDCPYGPREILGNNEYGLLTPPHDAAALAEAVLRLLTDPVVRHTLIARGRQRAQELSVQRMAKAYAAEFFKLLS